MRKIKRIIKKRRDRGVFSSNLIREREKSGKEFSLDERLGKAVSLDKHLEKRFKSVNTIRFAMRGVSKQKQLVSRVLGMETEEIGQNSRQLRNTSHCFSTSFKFILIISNSSIFPPNIKICGFFVWNGKNSFFPCGANLSATLKKGEDKKTFRRDVNGKN